MAGANVVPFGLGANVTYSTGMPIRFVAFPFPFSGQKREVLKSYVEGKDMVSGQPMMQAIVAGLTRPLTAEEQLSGPLSQAAAEPRLLPPDTEENLQRLFKDKEWTDFNPVILPTEERVAAMLQGTSHQPDELVKTASGTLGARRPFTVEKVAILAVMAGAKPEHFPLILALTTQVPFGNSTSSMANIIVVNGPIRKALGMNCGTNVLGPHSEVNAVIGRVFTLLSKTVGHLHSGVTTFSTLGSNMQYNNMTLAEHEERLPQGWDPLHVQMGFKPDDNVVTVGIGWTCISSVGEVQRAYPPHMLMRDYMSSLTALGSAAVMIMDPSVADLLHDLHGFDSKTKLSQWFSQNVEKNVASFWGNGVVSTFYGTMAHYGMEPFTKWRKLPGDETIKPFNNPKAIHVIVTGGGIQTTWFATDFRLGKGVLIDPWR